MNYKNNAAKAAKEKLLTKNFLLISIVNFLLFFGFEMLATVVSLYIAYIGGDSRAVGLSMGIFTLTALIIRAVTGILLDRMGRKKVFFAGLVTMVVITYVYGLIPSVGLILGVRFLHGIGWGISSTSSNTVASDNIPRSRFGEGMGWFGLSNSLGMAVGPATGLTILNFSGYRNMFTFSAATAFLCLVLALFISYPALTESGKEAVGESTCDAESDIGKPVKKGSAIEKGAVLPAVTIMCISVTYGALVSFLALFAQEKGISNIGSYFTVYAAAMLLTRPAAGRLTDKKGTAFVVVPAIILCTAGMVVLGLSQVIWHFLISAVLYGMGMGSAMSSLQTMAVTSAPAERTGSANATFMIGFDGGIGIGSMTAGLLVAAVGYGSMFLCLSGCVLFSGLIFAVFSPKKKR